MHGYQQRDHKFDNWIGARRRNVLDDGISNHVASLMDSLARI
jgi:hypothetical protein